MCMGVVMARRILITSGKGGVGKTTICVNLGKSLAKLNKKVLLIDLDFGLNNLDVVMSVENKIVYDIFDVVEGKCRIEQAIIEDFDNENLFILPTNRTYCPTTNSKDICEIVNAVDNKYDYILIDCPAGMDEGFVRGVNICNEAIVVVTPHISSVRDADKIIVKLEEFGVNLAGLIINRARGDLILQGDMLGINTIVDYLALPLYGILPEDDEVGVQVLVGGNLNKSSQSFTAYKMLARRIAFGESEIFDCTARYKGFIGGIRQKLRKHV